MKQALKMKKQSSDLLQKAYRLLPEHIESKPAYAIKDEFGNMCAIELNRYIVVARKGANSEGGGSVVLISRLAVETAEQWDREILLYLDSSQKFYPITPDYIRDDYIRLSHSADQTFYMVPLKGFVEYRQQKFENMQEALF